MIIGINPVSRNDMISFRWIPLFPKYPAMFISASLRFIERVQTGKNDPIKSSYNLYRQEERITLIFAEKSVIANRIRERGGVKSARP